MKLKFQGEPSVESSTSPVNLGCLFLRMTTVVTLIYYELALHLHKAWNNVWKEEPWGLVDQFTNLNLPLPATMAVAIILTAVLTAIGVFLGFLGRINAIILILILGFLLVAKVQTSDNFTPEVIVLYIIILTTLLFTGPGRYSMDYLMTTQRNRRKA